MSSIFNSSNAPLTPLAAASASGVNGALLELKIEDIGAVPAPLAKASSADTHTKAKH
jgi:hypothetical protein